MVQRRSSAPSVPVPAAWEFFTALIETMPVVPYIDVPDEGLTLYIGPQARDILGIELVGRS